MSQSDISIVSHIYYFPRNAYTLQIYQLKKEQTPPICTYENVYKSYPEFKNVNT